MATYTIVIIEQSPIIRKGLFSILKRIGNIYPEIYLSGDVEQVKKNFCHYPPNLLIINSSFVVDKSISVLKKHLSCEKVKAVALMTNLTAENTLREFDSTISIFEEEDQIKQKLEKIMSKKSGTKDRAEDKEQLSEREKDILVEIVKGHTNKQVAQRLSLSVHTVVTHRRNISTKLQINSIAGLTIYAISNKLIDSAF